MRFIKFFSDISIKDVSEFGGKNASLGEMIQTLTSKLIEIPNGFATTADSYWYFLEYNNILPTIKEIIKNSNLSDIKNLQNSAFKIRQIISEQDFPKDFTKEVIQAYKKLSSFYNQKNIDVAVRSSATAEDLPTASFAGQQDTFLNIHNIKSLLNTIKKCMASLFTDRAIIYREQKGFDHFKVGISVGVQKMVRSDKAVSGVIFTLDTDTGFKDAVVINSSYGLGENVVKGIVNPDEFHVYKKTLLMGYKPIVKKYLGAKDSKLIYTKSAKEPTKSVKVPKNQRVKFSLTDSEILELASKSIVIEEHYSKVYNRWSPMDIEWAKDGINKKLYILQARPETVHVQKYKTDVLELYYLRQPENTNLEIITTGLSIGKKIAHGKARVLTSIKEHKTFNKGDILVTSMTDPDWGPLLKKAAAIITDKGGRTSHAAIVSRELGIPAVIGTTNATEKIKDGDLITVDCSQSSTGYIYKNLINFEIKKIYLKELPKPPVNIFVNIADPDRAYSTSFLPVQGVGLARVEFIITNFIKVHPMAICKPNKVKDPRILHKIKQLALAYPDLKTFFVDVLAQGIGLIASAFYPKSVTVRLSDFKSNEYQNLLGGQYFELKEENPMLGFRGAVRYCSPDYAPAFTLECEAIKKARDEMGFKNIKIMVPFVRTLEEAKCTIEALSKHGLTRFKNDLEIFMMCEIPSNVLLLEKFNNYFDGFSIGSNDLAQFTLAVDRDSAKLSDLFDERDLAVKEMLAIAIEKAKNINTYITICGQAPSDFPELAEFLIQKGIDSLSLNPDSVIPFIIRYNNNIN